MFAADLKKLLGTQSKHIFYWGTSSTKRSTLIVKDKKSAREITKLLREYQNIHPQLAKSKIKLANSLKLDKAKSLEAMLNLLPHAELFYDPTALVERACALLNIAKEARQHFSQLKGCYFNCEKRQIYFLMQLNAVEQDVLNIRQQLENVITSYFKMLTVAFSCSITFSTHKPIGKVIAIDAKSVIRRNGQYIFKSLLAKLKWPLLIASATSSLGLITAVNASPYLPAVSNLNAWLGGGGGGINTQHHSRSVLFGEGGVAAPIGDQLGVQVHGYDGGFTHHNIWSVDGYAFWRNPLEALVGPHVTYTNAINIDQTQYGLHGEEYVNQWTVVGEGGGVYDNKTGGGYYVEALVHWYTQPNLKVHLGGILMNGDIGGELGTEYQVGLNSLPGLSLFADVGGGSHDLVYGYLGVRYYFGANKPLINRHREDNIPSTLDLVMMGKDRIKHPRIHS